MIVLPDEEKLFFVEVVAGRLQQVCGWIDINHSCGSAKLKSY